MLYYIRLFNDRKGLNPMLHDTEFIGPILGPFTGIIWNKGELLIEYGEERYPILFSDEGDHIRYGGGLYNSCQLLSSNDVNSAMFCFDAEQQETHDIHIFKQLNGIS